MGVGTGVTGDRIVEQVFREILAFRIYDSTTEVHKWSLAEKITRDHKPHWLSSACCICQ